jgi:hypothetical protein
MLHRESSFGLRSGNYSKTYFQEVFKMGKKNIEHRNASKMGKKYSHTGNKPLVESLTNKGVMVTQKVRKAQEAKRNAS